MNDAELDLRLRVSCTDGIREAFEPIHAGDENVLHTAILELCQDAQSELGALVLGEPHAQQFLVAFEIDAQGR